MKKIIALVLALVMVLALVGCGGSSGSSSTSSDVKTYKVGVAIYQFDDNFMTLYRNELQDYMKSLETDDEKFDITIVDGKNDMAEQSNQIDNFITQGMDVIILNLVQTSSADAIIDKIVENEIPLILINREPLGDDGDESYKGILDNPGVCYVGADARQSGSMQGALIADLENHGGGGLDQVQNDDIHTLGEEVVDLVGLFSHIVLAVDDGDVEFHVIGFEGLHVAFQFIAIQGHEVIIELINGDTDFVGVSGGRQCAGKHKDHGQDKKH